MPDQAMIAVPAMSAISADAIGFFGADRGFCLDFPRHRFCATRFFAFGARPWRTNTRL